MVVPTPIVQYMLELTNRARLDPWGEFDRLVTHAPDNVRRAMDYFNVDYTVLQQQFFALEASAPLAWNSSLGAAADAHSGLMIVFDQQSHRLPGEPSLGQRALDAGYFYRSVGENVYAYSEDAFYGHAGFFVDWGNTPTGIQDGAGHRVNIMNPIFVEIGIGYRIDNDPGTAVGPHVITQNFGTRPDYIPQLTGVVLNDTNGDRFYDIGEGVGGVTISATGLAGTFSTTTWEAGGYNLALPNGFYNVTFSYGGRTFATTAAINGENVKLDAMLTDMGMVVSNGSQDSLYDVSRFYNPGTGAHFYTANDAERDAVISANVGFIYEGNAFDSNATATVGVAVYRFFNEETGVHFYTANTQERGTIKATLVTFRDEGVAYYAHGQDGADREALHRFYNIESGTHFYTISEAERDDVIAQLPQYLYEGIAYYVEVA